MDREAPDSGHTAPTGSRYQDIITEIDGMFDDDLEEAVVGLKKSLDAQNTELLMLIAEYDRRKISSTEYELSTTAWLKYQCRMSGPLSPFQGGRQRSASDDVGGSAARRVSPRESSLYRARWLADPPRSKTRLSPPEGRTVRRRNDVRRYLNLPQPRRSPKGRVVLSATGRLPISPRRR